MHRILGQKPYIKNKKEKGLLENSFFFKVNYEKNKFQENIFQCLVV
jgi:hypothetical protein